MIKEDTQTFKDAMGLETTSSITPSSVTEETTDFQPTFADTQSNYSDLPQRNPKDPDFAQVSRPASYYHSSTPNTTSQDQTPFVANLNSIDIDYPLNADDLGLTQPLSPETTKVAMLRSLAGKLMELANSGQDSPLSMLMASGEHTAFINEEKGQAEFAMAMLNSQGRPAFFAVLISWKNQKGCYVDSYEDKWMNFPLDIDSDDPADLFAQIKEHLK